MRHLVYSGAWKKLEPVWDMIIRAKQVNTMLPVLEGVLNSFSNSAKKTDNLFNSVRAIKESLSI
ncbi:hypothetical protein QUB80_27100 [Chlorogloeopsis sp. ULAP01]|uniref:hypothetical protein n=1 Tax=Chlorogloeopsis sp. ULAP01 TaxID=3056483 RepID=UPI0025AAB7B0|nr:hypothetical protein [Chlorogloeopsis sp. ULAP01]MDM9384346.1 hypothetical protein [Chlorogloeopsis sp. ULAP01]